MSKYFKYIISTMLLVASLSNANYGSASGQDTIKPELQVASKLFVYNHLTTDEVREMLLLQMTAIDNVDGNITDNIQFNIPETVSDKESFYINLKVSDTAGNLTTKGVTVYVVEGNKYFTGLTPVSLKENEEVDLLQDVRGFDDSGNPLKVEVESIKMTTSTNVHAIYELKQVHNNVYKATAGHELNGSAYEVNYKTTSADGTVRKASRFIDTSINMEDPYIANVELSSKMVKPGERLKIEATIFETKDKIDYVFITYSAGSNYSSLNTLLYYNAVSKKYEGYIEIPPSYENKEWQFKGITIRFVTGRSIIEHAKANSDSSFFVFNGNDLQPPTLINNITQYETTLNKPVDYLDGVTAFDIPEGDITNKIEVNSTVNYSKAGTYLVEYEVKDSAGNVAKLSRKIIVRDKDKPTLKVKKAQLEGYIQQGADKLHEIIIENATAYDAHDGDVTSLITYKADSVLTISGEKLITYTAVDQAGNSVTDTAKLMLHNFPTNTNVYGNLQVIAAVGIPIDLEKDFYVTDSYGERLDPTIIGNVDFNKAGKYPLTYRYVNRLGETIEYTRTIEVKEKSLPYFGNLSTVTTVVGKPVDYFGDVGAYDMFGNKIGYKGSGYVNFDVAGTYTYDFQVEDSLGQIVEATRTIIVEGSAPFLDVPEYHPYFKEITTLKNAKIINGYPGNLYGPKDAISRGQVAALISRSGIDLKPIRDAKQFKDVSTSHMFYNEIQTLYQAGIIDGTGDYFNPNDSLTREQLAKILVLAFSLKNQGGYEYYFNDINQSDWAYEYILNLASNGITIGAYNNYMPKDKVTREQYAIFMYRALGY